VGQRNATYYDWGWLESPKKKVMTGEWCRWLWVPLGLPWFTTLLISMDMAMIETTSKHVFQSFSTTKMVIAWDFPCRRFV